MRGKHHAGPAMGGAAMFAGRMHAAPTMRGKHHVNRQRAVPRGFGFKRIIDITYQFSAGWRKVHNPDTGDHVADNLSTSEFTAAMLVARGWTNQEIADHLRLSPNTVKWYISNAMNTLGIQHRQDLKDFMLP